MSTGRRDYTGGYLIETSADGRFNESFIKVFDKAIAGESNNRIYSYTVPAGYRLGLNSICLSTNSGGKNYFTVEAGGNVIASLWFNDTIQISFSDRNTLYLYEDDTLYIDVNNLDEITYTFRGVLIATLETL